MHGRIKVRSTAEQAEAKRKEREKKLKIYTQATEKVYAKRAAGELDDEAIKLTEELLSANPDFSTMWNLRRELFLHMKESRTPDKLQEMCKSELRFLESCLRVNPKSYGVWHHREWMNEFMSQSDWRKELNLCNLFLTYDERNFHCWDYRRFVVKKAEITAQEEFDFSTNKIQENFSNYSSWHYRSKLLPLIHPDPSGDKERVEETALMKEFELAQNAFFTDPYDQSAWFYHRWLLGRARRSLAISCTYVHCEVSSLKVVLHFTQPVEISKLCPVLFFEDKELSGEWHNPFHNKHPSPVWIFSVSVNASLSEKRIRVTLLDGKLHGCVTVEKDATENWDITRDTKVFRAEITAVHGSVLQAELESCRMLLEEEPGNKWTLLTMVLLMRALDPLQHEQETMEFLDTLKDVDPYRKGYYCDLGRKFRLENAIERYCGKSGGHQGQGDRTLDLSKMDLSHFQHSDQLVLALDVNLSHNRLTALDSCNMLQCVRALDASHNKLRCITKANPLRLDSLEQLTLRDNEIGDVSLLSSLRECTTLRRLDLRGNPVCSSPDYRRSAREMLPTLEWLDGDGFESLSN